MVTAVVARQQGDDYQARVFWLEACRLFARRSKVARVAYEFNRIKAFDDVVVTYSAPLADERGGTVLADYYQAKYHVDRAGSLTAASLIDPEAIGATTVSLLERLHIAVRSVGDQARFNFISAWGIHPDDVLAEVVSNRNGEIRLDKLFDGTTDASAKGKVRKAWRKRLGLKTNDELRAVISPLRIHAPFRTLDALRIELNFRLEFAGLRPVEDGQVGHLYDDLIRKLHADGSNDFDRDALQAVCHGEGLWVGRDELPPDRTPIGIRSFLRFAEHLADETEHLLCLLKYFDGRKILIPTGWQGGVGPDVKRFLEERTGRGGRYLLYLDAHTSVALVAGYTLDTKSGVDVALVQRGSGKTAIWEPNLGAPPAAPVVTVREEAGTAEGGEVAVALSVSNEIAGEVVAYVRRAVPSVGKVVVIEPVPGPGQTSVRDADHAFQIAEAAVAQARARRPAAGGTLHLFSSAPNSVMFFFGRLARSLGWIQVYEYQFEAGIPGAYETSLTLPVG
jgi:hypothetical protein